MCRLTGLNVFTASRAANVRAGWSGPMGWRTRLPVRLWMGRKTRAAEYRSPWHPAHPGIERARSNTQTTPATRPHPQPVPRPEPIPEPIPQPQPEPPPDDPLPPNAPPEPKQPPMP